MSKSPDKAPNKSSVSHPIERALEKTAAVLKGSLHAVTPATTPPASPAAPGKPGLRSGRPSTPLPVRPGAPTCGRLEHEAAGERHRRSLRGDGAECDHVRSTGRRGAFPGLPVTRPQHQPAPAADPDRPVRGHGHCQQIRRRAGRYRGPRAPRIGGAFDPSGGANAPATLTVRGGGLRRCRRRFGASALHRGGGSPRLVRSRGARDGPADDAPSDAAHRRRGARLPRRTRQ